MTATDRMRKLPYTGGVTEGFDQAGNLIVVFGPADRDKFGDVRGGYGPVDTGVAIDPSDEYWSANQPSDEHWSATQYVDGGARQTVDGTRAEVERIAVEWMKV
jgi:hypothetical protein